jgi:hypothetical protein
MKVLMSRPPRMGKLPTLRKTLRFILTSIHIQKMPKATTRMIQLRFERVECGIFGHDFCKDIFSRQASYVL